MAKQRKTKRTATEIQDLPQPAQELTREQAGRVRGGMIKDNLQQQKQLRQAESVFERSGTGQSYTVDDFIGDVGG